MNEIIEYSDDGTVMHKRKLCPKCNQVIHTDHVFLKNGIIIKWDSECSCNNQQTLEEMERMDKIAKAEKIQDLVYWGYHDKAHREETFDSDRFNGNQDPEVRTMKYYAYHFVDEFYPKNLGMLLLGAQGTGKTFRTSNIANYIVDNHLKYVLYYPLSELVYNIQDYNTRKDIKHKIQVADLMIIDEFKLTTDRQIDAVYDIVETRYSAKKPLIVSSNMTPKEFKEETSIEKKRIYSRIAERCPLIFSFAKDEDLRIVIARENSEEFNRILNEGETHDKH